jgi:hypothetical protein
MIGIITVLIVFHNGRFYPGLIVLSCSSEISGKKNRY